MYQIFLGIRALHSEKIVHRDLKPNNILVSKSVQVVICDFCFSRIPNNIDMTEYVIQKNYRAIEVYTCPKIISTPVDIWSIGCVFYGLLNIKPLFNGKTSQESFLKLIEMFGTPLHDDLSYIESNEVKQDVIKTIKSLGIFPKKKTI